MRLNSNQKDRILSSVEKKLAERQKIDLTVAKALVNQSSLKLKLDETPMFIAHCGVDQLVDLVLNDLNHPIV